MKLKVLTPDKLIFDQEVDSITLPGTEGQMTILPTHTAMVATLKEGEMIARTAEKILAKGKIRGGFVEVLKNQVLVMTKALQTLEAGSLSH